MKVLVVGQGGREHVLAWKLAQSPSVSQVFCAPGNAGTAKDCKNVNIAADDIEQLLSFAKEEKVELTVIGPEVPLVAGVADAFEEAGLNVFGPSAKAAQLEGSKVFSKKIMKIAKIPTAEFTVLRDADSASSYFEEIEENEDLRNQPVVVKADGLAAGKGVIVCDNHAQAKEAVHRILIGQEFGEAGKQVIVEEFLEGEEVSILALVDGNTIIPLETSQDHKAAHDGDQGPNTGGMGAYSPAPIVSPELMDEIIQNILIPTVHSMKHEGCPFRGVLYAGLMLSARGPKVLEFNVRFGDPEAQPVLMRLKSDLALILLAAAKGKLNEIEDLEWDPRPTVCVVMASEGYPGSYEKGFPIRGLDDADAMEGVKVFHAGTTIKGNDVVNAGGRVLGVTAIGDDLTAAKLSAYQAVKKIRWDGAWCRTDISDKARAH